MDSSKPFQISWDTSCLDTTAVDIYLFAPGAATPRIHIWEDVNFAYGSYNTTLQPSWWNSTSSASLQLEIVETGTPIWMSSFPAGPLFNVTNSGSTSSSSSSSTAAGSIIEDVDNVPKNEGLSKGQIAAAVIMTLLAVAGIVTGAYIWRSRKHNRKQRKQFSVAVDKRMSTISTDWKPVTTAGATHAIRSSVYNADWSPTMEGGQAGIGSHSLRLQTTEEDLAVPVMAQIRPGFRGSKYSEADRQSRISRISFAPDSRPSNDSRRTRTFAADYMPPLPNVTMTQGDLSPTQATGPFSLSADDIRAHMAGQNGSRPSLDAVAPALASKCQYLIPSLPCSIRVVMWTDSSPTDQSYFIPAQMKMPEPELPTHPAPALMGTSAPQSPILGAMPMPSIPAMSPDAMLRAYAGGSLRSPPPTGAALAPTHSSGMLQLFSQDTMPATLENFGLALKPAPPPPASLYPEVTPSQGHGEDGLRSSFAVSEDSRYGVENEEQGTAM